jgi:hypothetical protein
MLLLIVSNCFDFFIYELQATIAHDLSVCYYICSIIISRLNSAKSFMILKISLPVCVFYQPEFPLFFLFTKSLTASMPQYKGFLIVNSAFGTRNRNLQIVGKLYKLWLSVHLVPKRHVQNDGTRSLLSVNLKQA